MNNGKQSLKDIAKEILLDFGVPAELAGYQYLLDAIEATAKAGDTLRINVKDLYHQVATAYNDTDSGVETAIRQAIDKTWDLDSTGSLSMFFGHGRKSTIRPDNREFIVFVADRVQMIKMCR